MFLLVPKSHLAKYELRTSLYVLAAEYNFANDRDSSVFRKVTVIVYTILQLSASIVEVILIYYFFLTCLGVKHIKTAKNNFQSVTVKYNSSIWYKSLSLSW